MSDRHEDDPFDDDDATPVDESSDDTADARGGATAATAGAAPRKVKKQRTSPRQFLREVRSELRKVAWPARKELISYSIVVLVSVTIVTLYITGLDYVFGQAILRMFGA